MNRSELRTVKRKSDENTVTFVSTFNPKNPELFPVIKHNFDILLEDKMMRNILSNYDKIKSKRQPPSLKKLLTKAKLGNNLQQAKISKVVDETVDFVNILFLTIRSISKAVKLSCYRQILRRDWMPFVDDCYII